VNGTGKEREVRVGEGKKNLFGRRRGDGKGEARQNAASITNREPALSPSGDLGKTAQRRTERGKSESKRAGVPKQKKLQNAELWGGKKENGARVIEAHHKNGLLLEIEKRDHPAAQVYRGAKKEGKIGS